MNEHVTVHIEAGGEGSMSDHCCDGYPSDDLLNEANGHAETPGSSDENGSTEADR